MLETVMLEHRAFVGHIPSDSATIAGILNSRQFPTTLLLVVSVM
jgi:hypothetical protein